MPLAGRLGVVTSLSPEESASEVSASALDSAGESSVSREGRKNSPPSPPTISISSSEEVAAC